MQSVEIDDDVISHIIVRNGVFAAFRKSSWWPSSWSAVKPLMGAHEILHLHIKAEVTIEEAGV